LDTGFDASPVPKSSTQSSHPVRDNVTRADQVEQRGFGVGRGGFNADPIILRKASAADGNPGSVPAPQWKHAPEETRFFPPMTHGSFGRDDGLVIATLRKAPLEPVESVFTVAAWIAIERLQGRNLHGLLGRLDQRTYSDTL
jgi:hypothetical protein